MRNLFLAGLVVLGLTAAAGASASSALAAPECRHVAVSETGEYPTYAACMNNERKGEKPLNWVRVAMGQGTKECAEVAVPGKGNFLNPACTEPGAGNFIKIVPTEPKRFVVEGEDVSTPVNLLKRSYAGKFVLVGTPFGVSTHITCTKVAVSGELKAAGADTENLVFSVCEVEKPANCTMTSAETKGPTALIEPASTLEDEFQGEGASKKFTTITLSGASCSLASKPFEVTGTQDCNLPGHEVEAVGHTIECTNAGSKLKAGGKEAKFEGTVEGLEVEGSRPWAS